MPYTLVGTHSLLRAAVQFYIHTVYSSTFLSMQKGQQCSSIILPFMTMLCRLL